MCVMQDGNPAIADQVVDFGVIGVVTLDPVAPDAAVIAEERLDARRVAR